MLDVAKSFGVAIVKSRLDYVNSSFFDTSENDIRKLRRIQNTLARIIVMHPLAAYSDRINFEITLLTFKSSPTTNLPIALLSSSSSNITL
jgi:hypothetical protein